MAIVVSKVDALLEMVKAYDNNQVKRSNCIGRILSNMGINDEFVLK